MTERLVDPLPIIRASFDTSPKVYSDVKSGKLATESKPGKYVCNYGEEGVTFVARKGKPGICIAAGASCREVASGNHVKAQLNCPAVSDGICPAPSDCANDETLNKNEITQAEIIVEAFNRGTPASVAPKKSRGNR